jgi:16S rRNA (adenine1518-N6/adenine1519-N6)-dimethyltransferase
MVSAINRLFSHRRKTVRNILKEFGVEYEGSQRLDELTDEEIVRIAETIR